jgi:hypothetical protein
MFIHNLRQQVGSFVSMSVESNVSQAGGKSLWLDPLVENAAYNLGFVANPMWVPLDYLISQKSKWVLPELW